MPLNSKFSSKAAVLLIGNSAFKAMLSIGILSVVESTLAMVFSSSLN